MQIRELKPEADLAEHFARTAMPDRTVRSASGVHVMHVSEIIRWVEVKTGKREARGNSEEDNSRLALYTSMGWAWEEICRNALVRVWTSDHHNHPDRFICPGELESDGIVGTPDWFDAEDLVVEEMKATWRSSNREITTDFWSWMVQIKAYCHLLGILDARLRVFFVNGNYAPTIPQIKMWYLSFNEREIADNWVMLKANAQAMAKEKRQSGNQGK